MNQSRVRRATRKWLSIVSEARSPGSPAVVGWRLPYLGCHPQLSARGPELLRESAARHGDTFSLYLGGRLITVCQEQRFMQAFYGNDDALARIKQGDLAGLRGGQGAEQLHGEHSGDRLRELLRRHDDALPIVLSGALKRHAQLCDAGRLDLVPTLRRWMEAMTQELLGARKHAAYEELATTTHIMAAVAALCLIHIKDEGELMSRLRTELDARGDAQPLTQVRLLNACFDEALRLYGPILHFRKTRRAVRAGRYILPAGRVVAFSPFLLHRRHDLYAEPDRFNPGRFLSGVQSISSFPQPRHFTPFEHNSRGRVSWLLLRTQALLCIDFLLRNRELFVSCVGEPTAVTWCLTGAAPSDQRWLHYVPRLHDEQAAEPPSKPPIEPPAAPPAVPPAAPRTTPPPAPRQSGVTTTTGVNLKQAAAEAAKRFAIA